MTDPTGATPPRDDDPNIPGQQPADEQPPAAPQPPANQPEGAPYGAQPPVAPQPPVDPQYGAPTGQPYGEQPPTGQPYPPAGQPYAQQPPAGQPYAQQPPAGQPPYPPQQPYAQQPYGAPAPGYAPPTAGSAIGDGFTWGWNKFTQNAGPLIGGLVVWGAGLVVLGIIFFAITVGATAASTDAYGNVSSGAAGGALFATLLFVALILLASVFVQAALVRAVTEIMQTGRTAFATFFKFDRVGPIMLAALLVGLATGIGSLVFYVGAIVVGFFFQFTLFFVIDKGLGAIDGIKASCQLAYRNFGTAALLYLVTLVASSIGGALCGIGTLVTTPLAMLISGFVFRRLHNEGVAA